MKEDLRGAETWPDGDGAAGENEVMGDAELPRRGARRCVCVHTHAC